KVYNSANKLFSLSEEQAIGIMIYGAASFMEVPWEIIIKSFKDYIGATRLPDLTDYANKFLGFLSEDGRFNNEEAEEIIIYRTFSNKLKRIVKEVEKQIDEQEQAGENVLQSTVTSWLME